MIQFPVSKKTNDTVSFLKAAINKRKVVLGQRFMIEDNPVTCVDIDNKNGKYIFSFDDVFIATSYDKIEDILQETYQTGRIGGIEIFPMNVLKDIDFLFVPSEYQIFGINRYGSKEQNDDHQFEWHKRGDLTRVKGWRGKISEDKNKDRIKGETCSWWLSSVHPNSFVYSCSVSSYGRIGVHSIIDTVCGIPIYFQMTRDI